MAKKTNFDDIFDEVERKKKNGGSYTSNYSEVKDFDKWANSQTYEQNARDSLQARKEYEARMDAITTAENNNPIVMQRNIANERRQALATNDAINNVSRLGSSAMSNPLLQGTKHIPDYSPQEYEDAVLKLLNEKDNKGKSYLDYENEAKSNYESKFNVMKNYYADKDKKTMPDDVYKVIESWKNGEYDDEQVDRELGRLGYDVGQREDFKNSFYDSIPKSRKDLLESANSQYGQGFEWMGNASYDKKQQELDFANNFVNEYKRLSQGERNILQWVLNDNVDIENSEAVKQLMDDYGWTLSEVREWVNRYGGMKATDIDKTYNDSINRIYQNQEDEKQKAEDDALLSELPKEDYAKLQEIYEDGNRKADIEEKLVGKYGDKAYEYADALERRRKREQVNIEDIEDRKYAYEHPVVATIKTFNPIRKLGQLYGSAYTLFTGDINSSANRQNRFVESVRDEVSSGIDDSFFSWLYNTGMSTADSLEWMAMSMGAGAVAKGVSSASAKLVTNIVSSSAFGLTTFESKYREMIKNGYDPEQAFATGIAFGVEEALFEYLSFDKAWDLIQKPDRLLKNWVMQSGIEGSEEVFTELSNWISDEHINGAFSEVNSNARYYMNALGMSKDEAYEKAVTERLQQIGEAGASGFVSGGLHGLVLGGGSKIASKVGGVTSALSEGASFKQAIDSTSVSKTAQKIIESNSANIIYENALQMPEDSQAYKIASKVESADELTKSQIKKIVESARANYTEDATQGNQRIMAIAESVARSDESDIKTLKQFNDFVERETRRANASDEEKLSMSIEDDAKAFNLDDRTAKLYESAFKDGKLTLSQFRSAWNIFYEGALSDRKFKDILTNEKDTNVALANNLNELDTGTIHRLYNLGTNAKKNVFAINRNDENVKAVEGTLSKMGINGKVIYETAGGMYKVDLMGSNGLSTGNSIYISKSAKDVAVVVAGHEFVHQLASKTPDLYKSLKELSADWLKENHRANYDSVIETLKKVYSAEEEDWREEAKSKGVDEEEYVTSKQEEEMVAHMTQAIFEKLGSMSEKEVKDFSKDLYKKDKKLWQKFVDFLKDFAKTLHKMIKGYKATDEGAKTLLGDEAQLNKFIKAYESAVVEFSERNNKGDYKNNGQTETFYENNGNVLLSKKSYETGGRRRLEAFLNEQVENKELTDDDVNEIIAQTDMIYNMVKDFSEHPELVDFSSWSEAEVKFKADGTPYASVIVNNGEYEMNIDMSTVCKKRKTLDKVLNYLVKSGELNLYTLTQKDINTINEVIKEHDLEIACAMCFVNTKRYRVGDWAKSFADPFNEMVRSLIPEGSDIKVDEFNFTGREVEEISGRLLADVDDSELDFSYIDKVIAENKGKAIERYANAIKENKEIRRILVPSEFISSEGLDKIRSEAEILYGLINSHGGTSKPKLSHSETQYTNDIIDSKKFTREKAYSVGGVRIQSFSDYMSNMIMDYAQMISELSAKKLPAHSYTKVESYARIFGLTGVKINLSLLPMVQVSEAQRKKFNKMSDDAKKKDAEYNALRRNAGLDENGNYLFDDESFSFDIALDIINSEGYDKNVGTIMVGVSTPHILKALADKNISMVIPYHKSSINPVVARLRNIDFFTDYTNVQNTRDSRTGKKIKKSDAQFDFYESLQRTNDPKATADEYLAYCEKNKFIPKFDEFASNENYYKLLVDFKVYDKDGNYAPQQDVKAIYPDNVRELILNDLKESQTTSNKMSSEMSGILDDVRARLNEGKGIASYSKKDSTGRTLSDDQIKYFENSKVRDKDGNLIPMYHGSRNQFTEFDREKIGSSGAGAFEGTGFNFTPSKSRASSYGSDNVMEGYVNIENPLSAEKITFTTRQLADVIAKVDPTGDDIIANYCKDTRDYGTPAFVKRESLTTAKAIMEFAENDVDIYSDLSASGGRTELMNAFQEMGYDGLIHYYEDGSIKTAITFDSNQFKDMNNVHPTENADIMKAKKRNYFNADYIDTQNDGIIEITKSNLNTKFGIRLNDRQYAKLRNQIEREVDFAFETLNNVIYVDAVIVDDYFFMYENYDDVSPQIIGAVKLTKKEKVSYYVNKIRKRADRSFGTIESIGRNYPNLSSFIEDRLRENGYDTMASGQRADNEGQEKNNGNSFTNSETTGKRRTSTTNGTMKSKKDNQGRLLTTDQYNVYKNVSPEILDSEGRLKTYYHGTETLGFTTFDNSYSDDGISFFFTDDKNVANSYSGSDLGVTFSGKELEDIDEFNSTLSAMANDQWSNESYKVFKEGDGYVLKKGEHIEDEYGEWQEDENGSYLYDYNEELYKGESLKDILDNLDDATDYEVSTKANYEVYVRAENPLVVDCDGNNWDELSGYMIQNIDSENEFDSVKVELYRRDGAKYVFSVSENQGEVKSHSLTIDEISKEFGDSFAEVLADKSYINKTLYKSSDGTYLDFERTRDFTKYAFENGYDSVVFNDILDIGGNGSTDITSQVVAVFESNQVNSVFNEHPTKHPDIMKSRKGIARSSFDRLNSGIGAENIIYEGAKLTNGHQISNSAVNKIANEILRDENSLYAFDDLKFNLNSLFKYIEQHPDANFHDMMRIAYEIAMPVVKESAFKSKDESLSERIFNLALRIYQNYYNELGKANSISTEKLDRVVNEIKDKYDAKEYRRKEREEVTKLRKAIRDKKARLDRMIAHPTKGSHIPEDMMKAVVELANAIDTTTDRMTFKATEEVNKLKDLYDKIQRDETYSYAYDSYTAQMISILKDVVENKRIIDLNKSDLEKVDTIMSAILTQIKNENEFVTEKTSETIHDKAVKGTEAVKLARRLNRSDSVAGKLDRAGHKWKSTLVDFERLVRNTFYYMPDSVGDFIIDRVYEGEMKELLNLREGNAIFDGLIDGDEEVRRALLDFTGKNSKGKYDESTWVELPSYRGGKAIKVPKAFRMSIIMHLMSEDNIRHIAYGGFALPNIEDYMRGDLNSAYHVPTKFHIPFFDNEDVKQAKESAEALEKWSDDGRYRVNKANPLYQAYENARDEYDKVKNRKTISDEEKAQKKQARDDAWQTFQNAREDAYRHLDRVVNARAKEYLSLIFNDLSEYELKMLDASQKFFWNWTGDKINETSMKLKGYKIAGVTNYFPIRVDTDSIIKENENLKFDATLEGMGFLKERVSSKKPIYLEDITNVILRSLRNVSKYNGYAESLRDAKAVLKYASADMGSSLERAIRYQQGDKVFDSIEKYLTDIETSSIKDNDASKFLARLRSRMAGATLTGNVGVMIKQSASFPTAIAVLDTESVTKALKNFASKPLEEVELRSALMELRRQGFTDAELGDIKKMKASGKKFVAFTGMIQWMDIRTTTALQYASKYWVDKHTNLTEGTDEYWDAVAEKFNEVIRQTQPNYSSLERPQLLQSSSDWMRLFLMYKTQTMQNFGILFDAISEAHAMKDLNKQGLVSDEQLLASKKKMARAIGSHLSAQMTFVIFDFVAKLLYHQLKPFKDDDDKWDWLNVGKYFVSSFLEAELGMLPFVSELVEALTYGGKFTYKTIKGESTSGLKYYGLSDSVVEEFNGMVSGTTNVIQNIGSYLYAKTDADKEKYRELLGYSARKWATNIAQLFGVPVNNVYKPVNSMVAYFVNGNGFLTGDISDIENMKTRTINAMMSGDTDKLERLYNQMVEKSTAEDPYKSTNSSLSSEVHSRFIKGEVTETQAKSMLKYLKYDKKSIDKKIKSWKEELKK